MSANENNRETGARKLSAKTASDASDEFSLEAARNEKPAKGMGLTESQNDVNDKTRHSEGRNQDRKATMKGPSTR